MSEVKVSILDKEITRRKFLKVSGKGLAGITVTSALLSLLGCNDVQDPSSKDSSDVVEVLATPKGLLVIDSSKCAACQRCEVTCTQTNDGKAASHISRVKVRKVINYDGDLSSGNGLQGGNFNFHPLTCKQCKEPDCKAACPASAIDMAANGMAWVVDVDKCVGCGACTQACPWHMPTVDTETNKSTKCVACGACATTCITGALSMIDWEDVRATQPA